MSTPKLMHWEKRMLSPRYGKLYQLQERASWCARQLALLTSLAVRLLSDEHFVALLRAEGLHALPAYLGNRVKNSRVSGQGQL